MITLREARNEGKSDKADGLSNEELDNIAESFIENFGGALGESLAAAYRKGAGL